MKRLGRVSNGRIIAYRELSAEEYETFQRSNSTLIRFMQEQQTFHMVVWNHKEFEDYLTKISMEYYENQSMNWFIMERRMLQINRLMLNLLSMFRTYLDHSETITKRRYGVDSAEFDAFKKITSEAYDSSFAYRFLYKLRNYAQHCGMPVGRIKFSSSIGGTPESPTVVKVVGIYFQRDQLLQSYDGWGAQVQADLRAQPDSIDVVPLVRELMIHLDRINVAQISRELPEVERSARFISELFDRLPKDPGPPGVMDFSQLGEEGGNIQIEWPALHLVETLKQSHIISTDESA